MAINSILRNVTGRNGMEIISNNQLGLKVDGVTLYINENGELAAHVPTDPPVEGTTYKLIYTLMSQINVTPPGAATDIVLNDSPIADVIEDGFASGEILDYSGTTININTSSPNLLGRNMNLKIVFTGTLNAPGSSGITSYITKNNEVPSRVTGTPIYTYNVPTTITIDFPFTCNGGVLPLNLYVDGNAQLVYPVPDRYSISDIKITLERL